MNLTFLMPGISNKALALATALAIAAAGLVSSPAQAVVPDEGSYSCETGSRSDDDTIPRFRINSDGIVFGGSGCVGTVLIPEGATGVGLYAFYDSQLTSITIPVTVTLIDNEAFANATALTSITIPNSVTSIGNSAFERATALTSITLPNSVTSIGDRAFAQTRSLESVILPDSLTRIRDDAFWESGLKSITIPSGVSYIDDYAFYGSSLSNVYFLGNAPSTAASAFDRITRFAKAFIQTTSVGFQPDDSEAPGYGGSQVEFFWKGLIVRPAPAYQPASLYRNWQTPLPAPTSAPKVGDTLYASAFERELSRSLYNPDDSDLGADYRTDTVAYPTLEEYVYRITKDPNEASSSFDLQSNSTYESLSAGAQDEWYEGLGFDPELNPYQFSWNAFMCVEDRDGFGDRTIAKPTSLTLSYASREEGIRDEDFDNDHSFMFRDTSIGIYESRSPRTRTVVGIENPPTQDALIGGPDVVDIGLHGFGFSEVASDCGVGKTLQALRIVDPETNIPITSKALVVPTRLTLEVRDGDQYANVDASGLTIGVTGGGRPLFFNAALWGLTTIAGLTPPPVASQPSGTSQLPEKAPAQVPAPVVGKSKSTLFAGFAGDSSRLTASLRKAIVKLSSGLKKVVRVECTGLTSGATTSRFDLLLAKNRAKAACDLVRQSSKSAKSAKVLLRVKPATGEGAKFRSVEVKITGN